MAPPGKGILDTFQITCETGETILVASDSGCTGTMILEEAITKGQIQHVQTGNTGTVQVAGGSRIPGEMYNCLLPLKKRANTNIGKP